MGRQLSVREAVWPIRRVALGSVSVTVTPYWTTLLVTVCWRSIAETIPFAVRLAAENVTTAFCPSLTLLASASATMAVTEVRDRSASVMKPVVVELLLVVLELEPPELVEPELVPLLELPPPPEED